MKIKLLLVSLMMLGIFACNSTNKEDDDDNTENNGNNPSDSTAVVDYSLLRINEVNGNGADADKYIELYNNSDVTINLEGVAVWYNNVDSEESITWYGTYTDSIVARNFLLLKGTKGTGNLSTGLSAKQGIVLKLTDPDGKRIDSLRVSADENREKSYSRIPDGTGMWYYTNATGTQDATNGTSTSGLSEIVLLPAISNFKRDISVPTPTQSVVVSATVTASFGIAISSVALKWTINGIAQGDITMTASGDTYSATIPAQADGATITYQISASNVNGAILSLIENYASSAMTIDYSGLVINEVDGNGKFVEIYNKSATAISLEGVTIVKNENGTWWTGKSDTVIAAKGHYTIAQAGGATGANEYTGNGGISPKKTVKFELKKPNGDLIDFYARVKADNVLDAGCTPDYGTSSPQYSFSRCPDGAADFGLAVPSCNTANPATPAGVIVTN